VGEGSGGLERARSVVDACVAERVAVYRTLLAMTGDPGVAEEIAQEAVARGIERAAQYRGPAPVGAWLHRIALNAWRDQLRRQRLRRWVGLDRAEAVPAEDPTTSADLVDMRRALARLPPRQRAALVLRYYHDYDYAAVGAALGVTEGSAGALLSRALDRLRSELQEPRPG
jgi:RNA polymerase sigma factor (sigma-70 family)